MLEAWGSLATAAVMIGVVHTATGPDHYLPFVAMSRIGRWSMPKTIIITLLCGVGHVLSSAVIGLAGIALGIGLDSLGQIESTRGRLAGWLLVGFGVAYLLWGLRQAIRNRPHTHLHVHADGTIHSHPHVHQGDHLHVHPAGAEQPADASEPKVASMTPWILFTIFLFGPCEMLIPMVMVPAARGDLLGVAWITLLFGTATLATMTVIVFAACQGVRFARVGRFARYGHAFAGAVLLVCGVAVMCGL